MSLSHILLQWTEGILPLLSCRTTQHWVNTSPWFCFLPPPKFLQLLACPPQWACSSKHTCDPLDHHLQDIHHLPDTRQIKFKIKIKIKIEEDMSQWPDNNKQTTRKDRDTQPMDAGRLRWDYQLYKLDQRKPSKSQPNISLKPQLCPSKTLVP